MAVLALPARPHPTALLLDPRSIETLLTVLCEMRGRMKPAPTAWRTEAFMRRLRALVLGGA
jgi:hypothetical protein